MGIRDQELSSAHGMYVYAEAAGAAGAAGLVTYAKLEGVMWIEI